MKIKKKNDESQNYDLFISPTAASDYSERFRDMYIDIEMRWEK